MENPATNERRERRIIIIHWCESIELAIKMARDYVAADQMMILEASRFLSDEWDTCARLTESDEVIEKAAEYLYGDTREKSIEWAKDDKFDGYAAQARQILAIAAQAIRDKKPHVF